MFIIIDYSQSRLKKYKIKMVTTSEIILAVIIVFLSIVMPIYYSYQRKKNPKQDKKSADGNEIKNYIDKINEISRIKRK